MTGAKAGNDPSDPHSRLASLRSLPTQDRSIWSFGRETKSADLVTPTSPLVPSMQAVRDARPSSLALCRGARMTTIGAKPVCRLQDARRHPVRSPTTTRRSISNCCQRVDVSPPREQSPRSSQDLDSLRLVIHNSNNFVSEIAISVGLRTPLITARYPVGYVTELRALNAPLISRK